MAGSDSQEPKFIAIRTANDLFQPSPAYSRTTYWNALLGTTEFLGRSSRTSLIFSLSLAHAVLENRPSLQLGKILKINYSFQKNIPII